MKGKKHSAEQIIKKLREAEAMIATGRRSVKLCKLWRSASRRSTAGETSSAG